MNKLDQISADIRSEEPQDQQVQQAAARVRQKLFVDAAAQPSRIRSCTDFQALIPSYLNKTLSAGRALLLQDHTRECVACRHALQKARDGVAPTLVRPITVPSRTMSKMWAVAALLVLSVGLGAWVFTSGLLTGSNTDVSIQNVSGILYAVSDKGMTPVFSGRKIAEGERVRTSKESTATVRLGDGSLVEMNERSEISVTHAAGGATIRLGRGDIIVQAAKQRTGTLDVLTSDCLVSVKGTVFAVNRGIKGSRVSVVEGSVKVAQGSQSQMLQPGEQLSTDPSLAKVPVQKAVAWSRDSAKYAAVLGELLSIQKRLSAMPSPGLRYNSKLLNYVPLMRCCMPPCRI
jgi:Fe2+-dicitrate sensor, membrane component